MLGKKGSVEVHFCVFSLEEAVPENDFYRKLEKAVDLSWVRERVAHLYSDVGRPSIDPEVFAKIELIGYLEGTFYERQLMRQVNDRLSLRRYIGYAIDDRVPDHSTLSKTRTLYGPELCQDIFDLSVRLCENAGMVSGVHSSGDRSLVKANASLDSLEVRVVPLTPEEHVRRLFAENPVQDGESSAVVAAVTQLVEYFEQPMRLPVGNEGAETVPVVDEGAAVGVAEKVGDEDAAGPEEQARGLFAENPLQGEGDGGVGPVAEVAERFERPTRATEEGGGAEIAPVAGEGVAVAVTEKSSTPRPASTVGVGKRNSGARRKANGRKKGKRGKGKVPPSNATHVSGTDPDARIVTRPGQGTMLAYEAEVWVDSKEGVVTHADGVSATLPEMATVKGAIRRQRECFQLPVSSVSLDTGYGEGRLYRQLEQEGIKGFVPHKPRSGGERGIFGIEDFAYDEELGVYLCPGGHELHHAGLKVRFPQASNIWRARDADCRECALRAGCTKGKHRELDLSMYQPEFERMEERVQGPGARLAAIARRVGPEPHFGQGKQWQGMTTAKYRGQPKFRGQVLLTCAAQNLKKYVKWIWRRTPGAGLMKIGQIEEDTFRVATSSPSFSLERAWLCPN